jgi:hypothetical protein
MTTDRVEIEFLTELRKLHTKMDWPRYKRSRLILEVSFSLEDPKIMLTWSGEYGDGSVKNAEIGPLMDEVYRRLGYDDRAEAAISSKTRRLAPPTED